MSAGPGRSLSPLAVYRRDIRASLERIWENVLDWEHLPWLHRGAFLDVHLLESAEDGWRAEVRLPPAAAARTAEIAVRLDRPALRYHTTTLAGFGAGSDIITELEPSGDGTTAITVTFDVPGVDADRREAAGAAYTRLYERLWNEDEAMMMRRQRLLDRGQDRRSAGPETPLRVVLGTEAEVRARLPLVTRVGGREIRLVDVDGDIVAHSTVCPHLGGPLAESPVEAGCITCPWHGYRYDLRTAASADGRRYRLDPAPRITIDRHTGTVTVGD